MFLLSIFRGSFRGILVQDADETFFVALSDLGVGSCVVKQLKTTSSSLEILIELE